jgi:O-antigen ligase
MIRYTLLTTAILFLAAYAWRDWYKVLCALIVMMAFVEHPDMPKEMFGIPGMNPWNVLLLAVLASWLVHRRVEDLRFDFPRGYGFLLVCYAAIILVGFLRGFRDLDGIYELHAAAGGSGPSSAELINDNLLNTFKWAIPGILVFTGARTQERQNWAMATLLSVCVLLALQIIRWMPLGLLADGGALSDRALRVFDREIGYHRVDLAALTAGGFWAIMNYRTAVQSKMWKLVLLGSAMAVLLGLALTGGRTGYGTWAVLGVFFAVMRSRKYLIALPVVAALVLTLVPAARERMLYGFSEEAAEETAQRFGTDELAVGGVDLHSVTSGRAIAWPLVVEKIAAAPWLGYGQLAMQREGVTLELLQSYGQSFPHPHNAYLEVVFDNGIIGAFPILLFFYLVTRGAMRSLRDRQAPFESAVAAVTLAFIGAQMIASIGSQSFYPQAGTVVMWCAIGLQLRILAQRRAQAAPAPQPAVRRRGTPAIRIHAQT